MSKTLPEWLTLQASKFRTGDGLVPVYNAATNSFDAAQAGVNEFVEYDNLAAFPATGNTGILYIAKDTNYLYRWNDAGSGSGSGSGSGDSSGYVQVGGGTVTDDDSAYELLSNKATDFTTLNDTLYPTTSAVQTAINSAVLGLYDLRGVYDASGNVYPSSGGSGTAGAILKGDVWKCSITGTLNGETVAVGSDILALVDSPGTTDSNWSVLASSVSGATALSGLSDVTITSPATNDVLQWNGTAWVNAVPSGGSGTVDQGELLRNIWSYG